MRGSEFDDIYEDALINANKQRSWLLVGLIAGFIASKIVNLRGDDSRLGIAAAVSGAFAGAVIYRMVSGVEIRNWNPRSSGSLETLGGGGASGVRCCCAQIRQAAAVSIRNRIRR